MVNSLKISREEIIQYLKFSCQIPAVLEAIATRQIITNATKSVKITVQADELQQSADASRVAYGLLRAGDTWNWLQAHHLSLDEFEEIAYTNVLSKKLAQHLFADQIEPLFFAHQLDHAGAVIYEIILEDEDLALELFYAIREGEICFQDAARQYIEDIELRRSGGYRGILSRLDLKPEISASVFAANPPQILKPIVTPKGVHLIWVEEIIQPQLDDSLRMKMLSDLFSAWLKQQLDQLEIVVDLSSVDPISNLQS